LIFSAQKSGGQVDLYLDSTVREVQTNDEGKATGVSFINKKDRTENKIFGKVVILAASA